MTTSTCSSLAMSPPLFGRDMRHVRDAEGLVTFHGPVDHIDGVAACDQIDEWPGGALPPVELVLAHQIDQLALLEGIALGEATCVARLPMAVPRMKSRRFIWSMMSSQTRPARRRPQRRVAADRRSFSGRFCSACSRQQCGVPKAPASHSIRTSTGTK